MKIVQRYLGDSNDGMQLWEDTIWADIQQARRSYPDTSYREVEIKILPIPNPDGRPATSESCNLEAWASTHGYGFLYEGYYENSDEEDEA